MPDVDRIVDWLEPDETILADCLASMSPRVTAVIDTNVLIDIMSIHDIVKGFVEAEKAGAKATAADALRVFQSPELKPRRERARDALLLAIYLHTAGATTFCARGEATRVLTERSPPVGDDGASNESMAYTRLWFEFILERVLPGWSLTWGGQPETISGEDVDDALLRFARLGKFPLITNETPPGKKKIPVKAISLGVRDDDTRWLCASLRERQTGLPDPVLNRGDGFPPRGARCLTDA